MTEVKCVVVGERSAGKSQVIIQFIYGNHALDYDPTIQDSYRAAVKVGDTDVLLDILDTAGQEDYSALREQYLRTADVIIIMYKVTDDRSFYRVRQYHAEVCRVKNSRPVPFILAGTKIEKRDTKQDTTSYVTFKKGLRMAAEIRAEGFYECSAKTRAGVNEIFQRAAEVGLQYVQDKTRDSKGQTYNEQFSKNTSGFHSLLLQVSKTSFNLFSEILKGGMEENYDIRVMLVGRAAVGKTTLTRRLLKLPVNLKEYNSTNGIDVHVHSCDVLLDSGKWVIKTQEKTFGKRLRKLWAKRIKKHEEKAKKTSVAGYRDFHLRCAKLMQKFEKTDFEFLNDDLISKESASPKDSDISTHVDDSISGNGNACGGTANEEDNISTKSISQRSESPAPGRRTIDTTDVEQMIQHAKNLPTQNEKQMAKVTLYDFAGQYIFHASHPTFLSPRAIYLLVYDLTTLINSKGKKRKKEKLAHSTHEEQYFGDCRGHTALGDLESIFFWLKVIYLFAAYKHNIIPQVILVGTHYDKLPRADRDALIERFYRDLRCEIAKTPLKELVSLEFVVDNSRKEDDSFSGIQAEIFRLAKLQPDWGKMTPAKWLPLEREIQCLKEEGGKVLSMEELMEINGSFDVHVDSEGEMEMFLQYLHDAGEIIFFSENELRNNIVLDPVWLIDALKLVITSDNFAVRIPKLAEKWIDFYKTGIIYRSTIVGIFEERTEDPALYENQEHILRLMEKFLFIAAPVQFTEDVNNSGAVQFHNNVVAVGDAADEEQDTCYIMPCMVHKEIDTHLITSLEGTSRSSVLCLVSINHFLPPAIFQKLLIVCIRKWPIVEQHGQKLIFCGVCKFNLDPSRNFKLTVFQVDYAIHARIVYYGREDHFLQSVCGDVFDFLVQSLKSVLKGMGFLDEFRTCFQCPECSPLENGGYIDTDIVQRQDDVTCDECKVSHSIPSKQLLDGWIDMVLVLPGGAIGGASLDMNENNGTGGGDSEENQLEDSDTTEDGDSEASVDIGPITQEHVNQARLCNVIVTVLADVLRDILVSQIPIPYADIYKALLAKNAMLRTMKQIGQEQFMLIFPDPQLRYTGTVDQFDITLLYALIRNISSCPAPATGWGKPPTEQPRDATLSANVERIRLIRNKVSGHSKDGKLEDQEYEDYMAEIVQILDDVEVVLGDNGYKDALEERRKQVITPQDARTLRKKFENYRRQLKEEMMSVKDAFDSLKESMVTMDEKVEQLSTMMAQNL